MKRIILAAALAFSLAAMPVGATKHPYEQRDAQGLAEALYLMYQHRFVQEKSGGLCITFRLFDHDIAQLCLHPRDDG